MPRNLRDTTCKIVLSPSNYEGSFYWCDDDINGCLLFAVGSVFYTRSIQVALLATQSIILKSKSSNVHPSKQLYVNEVEKLLLYLLSPLILIYYKAFFLITIQRRSAFDGVLCRVAQFWKNGVGPIALLEVTFLFE